MALVWSWLGVRSGEDGAGGELAACGEVASPALRAAWWSVRVGWTRHAKAIHAAQRKTRRRAGAVDRLARATQETPARYQATLGQSPANATLAGPEEIRWVAQTMREKKLPCDALIYLGTDFTPSGWNTHNGEFTWHPKNFPEPKKHD